MSQFKKGETFGEAYCCMCGNTFIKNRPTHSTCSPECKKLRRNQTSKARRIPKENPLIRKWTKTEIDFLKANRHLSSKELSKLMDRSKEAINVYRHLHKIPTYKNCVGCGEGFNPINQGATCISCTPNEIEYKLKYRGSIKGKWQEYKSNAKKRNIPFEITPKDIDNLWGVPCSYCGDEIPTDGIDRIDSSKG